MECEEKLAEAMELMSHMMIFMYVIALFAVFWLLDKLFKDTIFEQDVKVIFKRFFKKGE